MRQALRRPHSAIDTARELWSMANPFAAQLADALEASWPAIARPNQLPPPGDWQVWLLLAGRGFGKTRTLARANTWGGRCRHPEALSGFRASSLSRVLCLFGFARPGEGWRANRTPGPLNNRRPCVPQIHPGWVPSAP